MKRFFSSADLSMKWLKCVIRRCQRKLSSIYAFGSFQLNESITWWRCSAQTQIHQTQWNTTHNGSVSSRRWHNDSFELRMEWHRQTSILSLSLTCHYCNAHCVCLFWVLIISAVFQLLKWMRTINYAFTILETHTAGVRARLMLEIWKYWKLFSRVSTHWVC